MHIAAVADIFYLQLENSFFFQVAGFSYNNRPYKNTASFYSLKQNPIIVTVFTVII